MLTAKFLRMAKGGTQAIYEVRGTSSELSTYVANNFKNSPNGPVYKSSMNGEAILDSNGNKTPLLFTSYPMPGKNLWHPLYQVQSGPKAGSFTLDKAELQFAMLVSKSTGGAVFEAADGGVRAVDVCDIAAQCCPGGADGGDGGVGGDCGGGGGGSGSDGNIIDKYFRAITTWSCYCCCSSIVVIKSQFGC